MANHEVDKHRRQIEELHESSDPKLEQLAVVSVSSPKDAHPKNFASVELLTCGQSSPLRQSSATLQSILTQESFLSTLLVSFPNSATQEDSREQELNQEFVHQEFEEVLGAKMAERNIESENSRNFQMITSQSDSKRKIEQTLEVGVTYKLFDKLTNKKIEAKLNLGVAPSYKIVDQQEIIDAHQVFDESSRSQIVANQYLEANPDLLEKPSEESNSDFKKGKNLFPKLEHADMWVRGFTDIPLANWKKKYMCAGFRKEQVFVPRGDFLMQNPVDNRTSLSGLIIREEWKSEIGIASIACGSVAYRFSLEIFFALKYIGELIRNCCCQQKVELQGQDDGVETLHFGIKNELFFFDPGITKGLNDCLLSVPCSSLKLLVINQRMLQKLLASDVLFPLAQRMTWVIAWSLENFGVLGLK